MKCVALIPARYQAARFPGKMMADLCGKTVILRTYEAVRATGLFDDLFVVTDSQEIYEEVTRNGGKALMSAKEHECGSDRIAEAAQNIEADIILNVQGDEPFMEKQALADLLRVFKEDEEGKIDLASLMQVITKDEEINNPNCVKVVVDKDNLAMLFSRSPIPYQRDKEAPFDYHRHIGVYAFRREALLEFAQTPMGVLEAVEKLECLRYLENGKKIKMILTEHVGIGIDSPDDLERARLHLQKQNGFH